MGARVASAAIIGVEAHLVEVETFVSGFVKKFSLTGLPDSVVKEARERVRCAIESSGFHFPEYAVVVHLGPSALPKVGANFDLAIAVSILVANGQLPQSAVDDLMFFSELSLDGRLRGGKGVLSALELCRSHGFSMCVASPLDAVLGRKAALTNTVGCKTLGQLVQFLRREKPWRTELVDEVEEEPSEDMLTFADVVGNEQAKRALEIAAAGGHNVLLVGPPGSGKSLLASRLPSILPALSSAESVEVARVRSIALDSPVVTLPSQRPFRAPHHSISAAGLLGGGSVPTPGEISLAHRGVLFLDELTEFSRSAIEGLRGPLEEKQVRIVRTKGSAVFPANFQLVAAMNPKDESQFARKSADMKVMKGISKPLLDRIDLQVWVPSVSVERLNSRHIEDSTELMRSRVGRAREAQKARYGNSEILNAVLSLKQCRRYVPLDAAANAMLEQFCHKQSLSGRAFVRILRIARTIADLEGLDEIGLSEMAEALAYRMT
ncbi:MAG: YifB family Mg chelatase-like AAA ATPase [bacterium]|nr:YifB family Mg chelatase-like AAA ATPase [bacterium]